jgi:hypothetical protein
MRKILIASIPLFVVLMIALACTQRHPAPATQPVHAGPSAALGRHLIMSSGCNDCHTPGFMQLGMKVPEALWLTGVPVGWRGPWGTTYGSNLRLFVKEMDEPTFVSVVRARNDRPPMPWTSLHAMTDDELRAVFRYLKEVGPGGLPTPAYLPPGQEPATPWLDMSVHLPNVGGGTTKPKG